jgi:hypothetical protein
LARKTGEKPMNEKQQAFFTADFKPSATAVATDQRIAAALEYIAYHLGQINNKLDAIGQSLRVTAQRTK